MDADYTRKMADLQTHHWWYEGRRIILASLIKNLDLAVRATILEAGCGPGANLEMLACFGKVKAFEPDVFSVSHAEKISKLEVKTGSLPSPIPYAEQFDLICAFDVIEHIDDDLAALRALGEKIKPGGHALFTVPAHMWLWSEHDDINHHKRRYTLKQFRNVLELAGYRVDKISYYNMWLFPLAASVRLTKKLFGIKDHDDMQMPSTFANKALCRLFSSEHYLLKRFNLPFGLSIIAQCRKI